MLNSEELINKVKNYNKFLNPEKLNKAFDFAVKAHGNQKRDFVHVYDIVDGLIKIAFNDKNILMHGS